MMMFIFVYLMVLGTISWAWECIEIMVHGSSQHSIVDSVIAMYIAFRIVVRIFEEEDGE